MITFYKTVKHVKQWSNRIEKFRDIKIVDFVMVNTKTNSFESINTNDTFVGCLCEIKTGSANWLRQHFSDREVEKVDKWIIPLDVFSMFNRRYPEITAQTRTK